MSAAQLDILPQEPAISAAPESLRQQAAATLAAHRQRRTRTPATAIPHVPERSRRNPIAQSVQQKYAQSPSYRAFLADEAKRAIEESAAAAEVATRTAEAVAAAQHQLLQELELWVAPQAFTPATALIAEAHIAEAPAPLKQLSTPDGLTVRLYEDLGRTSPPPAPTPSATATADETDLLNQEIAFRQSPHFDDFKDPHGPIEPIAANLLEFPRQLVAARRVRPTLAEGPLLAESAARNSQLRIFEVEAALITHAPAPIPAATPAEWSDIRLGAHTVTEPSPDLDPHTTLLPSLLPPQTAAVHLRLMAIAVDALLIVTGLLTFTAVAMYTGHQFPTGTAAAITAAATLATLYFLYQALFFTLSDQTPGMRYARIGFCTFTDENPSRSAMRRRILANLVATCPFALGLFWVFLDDDRLGWHDRISRMYPRAY